MLEILHYGFMVRALLAGILVAITLPYLGGFLVARRYSLIADSLAHVSLAGIGLGLMMGTSPVLVAVPVTAAGAFLLEYLRQKKQISGETSLAILMSTGLAAAVIFANLARGVRADFDSYLFGSITTTQQTDLIILAIAAIVILSLLSFNYRAFLHIAFDEDGARIAGYKVSLLNYLLTIMTSVLVVLSLRIVGGLLIGALLVIPVVAASRISNSFRTTIIVATVLALVAVIVGLLCAFYMGVAAGGAIVITAVLLLVLSFLLPINQ